MKVLYLLLRLVKFLAKFPFRVGDEFLGEILYRDIDVGEGSVVVDIFWMVFAAGSILSIYSNPLGFYLLVGAGILVFVVLIDSILWVLMWD